MTAKERTIGAHQFLEHRRADRVDANAARHLDRRRHGETLQRAIDHTGRRAADDRRVGERAGDQRDRTAVAQGVTRRQGEVDLAHQLVVQAEAVSGTGERRRRDRVQWREIDAARGADDRVERSGRLEAGDDAGGIGDVDADRAQLRAGGDDVVALAELGDDRAASSPLAPMTRMRNRGASDICLFPLVGPTATTLERVALGWRHFQPSLRATAKQSKLSSRRNPQVWIASLCSQ